MATPTLNAYRQLNPQDTRDDAEVVPELISRLQDEGTLAQYPDLIQYAGDLDRAYRQAHRPNPVKEFTNALSGGVDIGQSQLYSTLAQGADFAGLEGLKNFGLRGYTRNIQEASEHAPTVPSVTDVHSPADALYYGIGLAGSQAPILGATLATTAAGALIGSAIGPEGTVGGALTALGGGITAARTAAQAAQAGGAMAGLLGAGYVQSQNYGALATSGANDAAITSAMTGALGGYLLTLVPSKIIHGAMGAEAQDVLTMNIQQLLKRAEQTTPGVIQSISKGIAEHGANNAILGVSQELVGMAGEMYANRDNPKFELTNKEITDRLLNGAAAGAALGAVFGSHAGLQEREGATRVKDFAAARAKELQDREINGLSNFITPQDPYAGLSSNITGTQLEEPETKGPLEMAIDERNAPYAALFDTISDNEEKAAARKRYDIVRVTNFYQSDRASELLRNQLSQEAGGTKINPVDMRPNPEEPGASSVVNEPVVPPTLPPSAADYRYTVQQPMVINGENVPGYTQIDAIDAKGNGLGSSTLAELESKGIKLPPVPEGLPTGQYSLKQIQELHNPGEVHEPAGVMEHAGEVPTDPNLIQRDIVQNTAPSLRKELTPIASNATTAEILKTATEGIRENESKGTTKRLIAFKNETTGQVVAYPVFRGTDNVTKVDNNIAPKVTSRKALAEALGMPVRDVLMAYREKRKAMRDLNQVHEELNAGSKADDTLEDVLKDKNLTPVAFLDMTEPANRRHFVFDNAETFKNEVIFSANQNIVTKGTKGGGFGVPQILKRLTEISSRDSRAVQILAGVLEHTPEAQGISRMREASNFRPDASLIIQRLLRSPDARTFAEKISNVKNAEDLLAMSNGRFFGLFTPEQWVQFKALTEMPNVTPEHLLNAVDQSLATSDWTNRGAFISSVIPRIGATDVGISATTETDSGDEHDNLSAQVIEQAGREGGIAVMQAAENEVGGEGAAPNDLQTGEDFTNFKAERKLGKVASFSSVTALEQLGLEITNPKPENKIAVRNIMDARADSEISNPNDDEEFKAIKPELTELIQGLFKGEVPSMSDDFLYGIYSNLDRISRDSQPRATYRVVNDTIQRTFHSAVSWLSDKGVDVRLIQQSVDSQIAFLRNEWGRSLSYEDGRRVVVLTMADITEPSQENLRVLFHEIAHQMFADEDPATQRVLHEAVERLTDLQLDVFSRTFDARLKENSLPTPVMMEEILAEHFSFMGIETEKARGLGQRLLDGLSKAFANVIMLYSKLRGVALSPEWAQTYMTLRFKDMLDKVLTPRTDLDTLTGNPRNNARQQATFYTHIGGNFNAEKYDPASGNFVVHDVMDESTLASRFNLDNRLQFSDVMVRDSRSTPDPQRWEREFGLSDKPVQLGEIIQKIIDNPKVTDPELKAAAMVLKDRSPAAMKAFAKNLSTDVERQGMKDTHPDASAVYLAGPHTILFKPESLGGFDSNDMAYLIMHEAVHAATVRTMDGYRIYNKYKGMAAKELGKQAKAADLKVEGATNVVHALMGAELVKSLSPAEMQKWIKNIVESIPHIQKIEKIFAYLRENKFNPTAYGMTDVDEFVSETMTNRAFQMELANVKLPTNLVVGKKRSVFSSLVNLVSRMFNPNKVGNALESSTRAIEQIMLVADPLGSRSERSYASPPITKAESDSRIQKDFEYNFAALNTQADFYHELFDKPAQRAGVDFDAYLKSILGIYNPEKSIRDLELRVGQRSEPIPINQNLRLSDGSIQSSVDKAQITKRLLTTTSSALGKLTGKIASLKDQIPRIEKDVEKTKQRFVRFETMLMDVTTVRDNALKVLRKGLRGAESNARRLVAWSTRHDGLAGVMAQLLGVEDDTAIDEDYLDLMTDSLDEHEDDFFITDALTAATQADIDFDKLSPQEIETEIQKVASTTRDDRLIPLADGSPQAKVDLALLIYFAKTAPEDMAALAVRVERDEERKAGIMRTIRNIIRGNVEATEGLNDLFKDVRKGDVKVGKAKQALTTAARQLRQTTAQLEMARKRTTEMESAASSLDNGIRKYQSDTGIRASRFEPHNGAKIVLTPEVGPPSVGTLKLGPDSGSTVMKIIMDNKKWLRDHDEVHDAQYLDIESQVEGLSRVAGDQADRTFRDSFLTRVIGSIPERLRNLGSSILRNAGDRLIRYYARRQEAEPIVAKGYAVTEAYVNAMKATGFENSYSGFKDSLWNPASHFLRHLVLLNGVTEEENRAYAKEQLKLFFLRNDATRAMIQKPGGFDAVWSALQTNAEVSSKVANKAADWKAMVEDSDIKIKNPRTGAIEYAKRPAMAVGLFTTQSNMKKVFAVKDILDQVKDQKGEAVWPTWVAAGLPVDPKVLFTDDVMHHFVKPYIYDTGTLHLAGPTLLDGKTTNFASPYNIQQAFEASGGDMVEFAKKLYDLENTVTQVDPTNPALSPEVRKAQFVETTLTFFRDEYKKINTLSEAQSKFDIKGMDMMASPMMDNVKAGDFPAEFMDYYVYDHKTLRQILSQLAAHAELGRDLGLSDMHEDVNKGIMWELYSAETELRKKQAEYMRLAEEFKRGNPTASVKEIKSAIESKIGPKKFQELDSIPKSRQELKRIEREIFTYFASPNGSTREMTLAQTAIGALAGGMVNNFKSTINQVSQVFEPFIKYGIGKTGFTQVQRYMESSARSGLGSFVQAVYGEASMASEYARYMSELGLGKDLANQVTGAQIIADTGKNNMYEDRRVLGWLQKGRSIMFDLGIKSKQEGERIAPAFRPWAPFSMMMISMNQGAIESDLRLYDDVLKKAVNIMTETPGARTDPAFQFSHQDIQMGENTFDQLAFEELKNEFRTMGTTMELEARQILDTRDDGKPAGNIVVRPDLARLIAGEALRRMSLPSDISSSAVWMSNSPLGRLAMPLITWSLNKTNQLIGAVKEPNGETSRRAMLAGVASVALGMVPAAILISILTDQYDEKLLSKKSNLVGFNFDDPAQTAVAIMERVGRVGTFGMAGDVVNGVRVYGTSGDLRGVSIDQRVVFVNTLMSLMGLASTAYNQQGTLTYDSFYRPLINTMGGGGILQNQQILNNITNSVMGVPIFAQEAETTARLNALNYLRGAGRVTGLDVRTGSGMRTLPNPVKPWIGEMVVATYSNNQSEFAEAYAKAVQSARDEGKDDPEGYVKQAFSSYHPLRYTFSTAPTKNEVGRLMGALSDKGREDVTAALQYFNAYGQSLGIKPYDGRENVTKAGTKQAPNPWQ